MPTALLAAVPYRTLPDFPLGPITIRTFGLMVALGIVLGTVVGSRYVANRGMDPEQYTSLATRAVIAGLIGARVTWVLSHLEAIQSPIDVIAVWDGGMQFSGGLLFGAVAGWLSARGRYSRTQRWHILDGSAVGLAVGLAIGRLGCMAVGEHFGGETDFFLGMTYLGGGTIEPVTIGQTIHNTAFYELLHLVVLSAIFALLLRQASDRQRPWPLGMLGTMFLLWYGVFRFITDIVRVNDTRLAGLTGAQWASFGLVALGIWLLVSMGSRRASQDGRAVVPVTTEPKSAVKLLAGSRTAASADSDGSVGDAAIGGDAADGTEAQAPAPRQTDADQTDPGKVDPGGADAGETTRGDARSGATSAVGQDPGGHAVVTTARTSDTDASGDGSGERASRQSDEMDDGVTDTAPHSSADSASSQSDTDAAVTAEPSWADRADVRDGSAGFVAGVRVVRDPNSAPEDPLARDEVLAEDDTSMADTSETDGHDTAADDTAAGDPTA